MEVKEQRKLICPICGGEMKTVSRYDVEIDICKQCKGIWLDRGELNKIVNSVSSIYDNLREILPDDTIYQIKKEQPDEPDYDKDYLKKIFEIDDILKSL